MPEPFIGEIRMVGFNFAPIGWALCNGQLLSIAQNQALFALLGTSYGGDGRTTFALPDLQGRAPIHAGSGAGLTPRAIGERGGAEGVTLQTSQLPAHTHALAAGAEQTTNRPAGGLPAVGGVYATTPTDVMAPGAIGEAGGSQPHDNMQPYLTVTFVIALQGIFPSRN